MRFPTSMSKSGCLTIRLTRWPRWGVFLGIAVLGTTFCWRSAVAAEASAGAEAATNHALIWVGLPGDEPHRVLFATVVEQWRKWLTERLNFEPANVHVVPATVGQTDATAWSSTRDAIDRQVESLRTRLGPRDRLWVFLAGPRQHRRGACLVSSDGPDPRDDEIGKIFAVLNCDEQVFWLTTPVSARFLKHLSRKGRVIVAAAGADEDNETEFAEAFCTVAGRTKAELDVNQNGTVSVRELAQRVTAEVQARYAADQRLVTEHAQLDDNGDGQGTELVLEPGATAGSQAADGTLADEMYVPFR